MPEINLSELEQQTELWLGRRAAWRAMWQQLDHQLQAMPLARGLNWQDAASIDAYCHRAALARAGLGEAAYQQLVAERDQPAAQHWLPLGMAAGAAMGGLALPWAIGALWGIVAYVGVLMPILPLPLMMVCGGLGMVLGAIHGANATQKITNRFATRSAAKAQQQLQPYYQARHGAAAAMDQYDAEQLFAHQVALADETVFHPADPAPLWRLESLLRTGLFWRGQDKVIVPEPWPDNAVDEIMRATPLGKKLLSELENIIQPEKVKTTYPAAIDTNPKQRLKL